METAHLVIEPTDQEREWLRLEWLRRLMFEPAIDPAAVLSEYREGLEDAGFQAEFEDDTDFDLVTLALTYMIDGDEQPVVQRVAGAVSCVMFSDDLVGVLVEVFTRLYQVIHDD